MTPEIVRIYQHKLKLDRDNAKNNEMMDALKRYRKKNKIKITKKMKKERKLFYLNNFFEQVIKLSVLEKSRYELKNNV